MGAESDEKVETQPKHTEDFTFQPRTSGSIQPALKPNPNTRQSSASLTQPKTPNQGKSFPGCCDQGTRCGCRTGSLTPNYNNLTGERDRSKVHFLLGDSSSGEESVSVPTSKKVSTSAREAPVVSLNISVGALGGTGTSEACFATAGDLSPLHAGYHP